eukprot:2445854-Pyramimonas_sp.AAC.1
MACFHVVAGLPREYHSLSRRRWVLHSGVDSLSRYVSRPRPWGLSPGRRSSSGRPVIFWWSLSVVALELWSVLGHAVEIQLAPFTTPG